MGGLGTAASEWGAEVIAGILYPDKDIKDLSQEERQKVSALSQLATGLAIAAAGGDIQDVNTGVAAGKNAVENNYLNVLAQGTSQLIKQGGKVCVKNTVCRTWATEQLIYAAATVGISLEVSDIDPDQLANIIDDINDNINLSLGPVGYSDFLTDKLVDYVLNNNNKKTIAVDPNDLPKLEGYPIPEEPRDPLPGYKPLDPEELGPNHTGGNQIPEALPPLPGYEPLDPAWINNALTADNRLPIPEKTTASNGLDIESNTKHTPGAQGFRPNAGVEPKNSLEIFEGSISIDGNKHRYGIDSEGNIHRYSPSNNGVYHWSGSTGDKKNPLNKNDIPNGIKKQLGVKGK
ncbi:VENN motif pre-toxin domain-containing protein [Gilliamella intestini]|uniref:Pre-toxin domain with VENN motif-containing protein n=1 Tax=Gilliamella intestini TaxID=1798183 RepID=A0A1C4AXG6_9GAMM|nr:VENN motif pre-toxin domain-containing protein [Gilliamella intestini]SCB99330.1 Pre-toxin domain with VENN motif-containing protein [Gilliamella intestini]